MLGRGLYYELPVPLLRRLRTMKAEVWKPLHCNRKPRLLPAIFRRYSVVLRACVAQRDADTAFAIYEQAAEEQILLNDNCHNLLIKVTPAGKRRLPRLLCAQSTSAGGSCSFPSDHSAADCFTPSFRLLLHARPHARHSPGMNPITMA